MSVQLDILGIISFITEGHDKNFIYKYIYTYNIYTYTHTMKHRD